MKTAGGHQKRIVLGVAVAAVALLGAAVICEWRPIRLAYWHWKALNECRKSEFDPEKWRPLALSAIIASGEEGYPTLARLLRNPDPRIFDRIWPAIDLKCASHEGIVEYLQRNHPDAAIRYLLPAPQSGPPWRMAATNDPGGSRWFVYWCGAGQDHLEPTAELVDWLEPAIEAKPQDRRTLRALAALLKPGEAAQPGGPLAERIVKILARAGRERASVEAIRLLTFRSTPSETPRPLFRIPLRGEWDDLSRGLPTAVSAPADVFIPADHRCREALLSLCHFDEVWTLGVITRLLRRPEHAPALEAILAERPRLGPLEMPTWRPPLDAARRFFSRQDPHERQAAAGFLAEEGLRDGQSLIREAMAGERDEPRVYYRSCLLALGDEEQRGPSRQALRELLDDPVFGRSNPNLVWHGIRLARNLLLSGDLQVLDWIIVAQSKLGIDLEDFISDLPPSFRRPNDWNSEDHEERQRDLLVWWAASKSRIAFDPARRKFLMR